MIQVEKLLEGYTFIDLFAGLGGFRLAMESLGAKCVYSNEWDKDVREVYFKNFHDMPDDDITKVDEKTIPDHDILCGGFPCQPFSISGNKNGFNDTRGTLFFDVMRVVKAKQPKIIFLENVKNLVTHNNGRTFKVIYHELRSTGYNVFYKVLNSADFDVPQKRERIYIIGFRNDLNIQEFGFPRPIGLKTHIEDILLSDVDDYIERNDYIQTKDDDIYDSKPIRLGTVNKGGQGERVYSTKGVGITLSAYGGGVFAKTGGYLVEGRLRKLHPRECARLQGFPDSYILSNKKTQAYKQLGNSVTVDVIQYIGLSIAKNLRK